jgi:hypothetical protein
MRTSAFIRHKIIDPRFFTEKGFPAGVMPGNFSQTLSKDEINGLVAYLTKVGHAK